MLRSVRPNATTARSWSHSSHQYTRLSSTLHPRPRSTSTLHVETRTRTGLALTAASALAIGGYFSFTASNPLKNDAPLPENINSPITPNDTAPKLNALADAEEHLISLAWGSNRAHLLFPEDHTDPVRTPASVPWLKDVALRDLVVHEQHAACVDIRGNVYQWGDAFFADSDARDKKPKLILEGKNITSLQITDERLFALSSSGQLFILPSTRRGQALKTAVPTPSSSPWWGTGWIWGEYQSTDFAEIKAENLHRGEKFVSISAGQHHLLALTSSGRTFAYPIDHQANTHGQLGFRRFDVPNTDKGISPSTSRRQVELTPKAIKDPHALESSYIRPKPPSTDAPQQDDQQIGDKADIRFSDKLFEVPALRNIRIAQVAAGSRSSFIRTTEGRVLAWGANEYGQLGLGANMTLNTVTVPTEVVLSRSPRSSTKCVDISAGGDLTLFTVERTDGTSIPSTDVLSCGMGQWGGLGNGLFSSAQGNLAKVKNVSGLVEFSERHGNLQSIRPHAISISSTGHVLLTLDTLTRSGPGVQPGRDLLVWGMNQDYQLGNGKRSSVPVPANLEIEGGKSSRLLLEQRKAPKVSDMNGKVVSRGVRVEQVAVAGPFNSFVYWKIVP